MTLYRFFVVEKTVFFGEKTVFFVEFFFLFC